MLSMTYYRRNHRGVRLPIAQFIVRFGADFPDTVTDDVTDSAATDGATIGKNPEVTSRYCDDFVDHSSFDFATGANDIALVRLSPAIVFSSSIKPLCTALADNVTSGSRCIVTGWKPPKSGRSGGDGCA